MSTNENTIKRLNETKQLKELQNDFDKVTKKVIKRNVSKNPEKLKEYQEDLIKTYNNFIKVARDHFSQSTIENKLRIRNLFIKIREKLILCFEKLQVKIKIPNNLNITIDIKNILETIDESSSSENSSSESEIESRHSQPDKIEGEEDKMVLTKPELLKLCSSTINKNFSGDPLALNAFLNSIDLLDELTENSNDLRTFLVAFIKSKLEGMALEAVPAESTTINDIKAALRAKITPDNSRIVEGKMQALRTSRKSLQDFAKEAEELAEALQRSLIVEGIPQQKAQDLATERTVEMCRASARTDIVKSVVASTKFSSPKEAIAKFIIETGSVAKENQVLSFRANRQNSNFNNQNQRYRPNNFNPNQRKPNHSFNRNNFTRYNNRPFQNQQNRNFNFNRNQNPQSNRNYYRNGNRQFTPNNTQQYSQNVRTFGSENPPAPQHLLLGAQGQSHTQNQ